MADVSIDISQKKDLEDRSPTELLEVNKKLDDELRILEIAKLTDEQKVDELNADELKASISELSEQCVDESIDVSCRNRLLKRAEFGRVLDNVLENSDNLEDDPFISASSKELELASEIMRIQEEITNLEETYNNEKHLSKDLQSSNQALMQRLRDHQGSVKSVSNEVKKHPNYKKLKTELEVKSMSVDINKNLITQIIIGARMDWMADPDLQSIMLSQDMV